MIIGNGRVGAIRYERLSMGRFAAFYSSYGATYQILQRDYVSQQRQWEEHQIRSAPEPAMVFEDESDVLAEVSLSDGMTIPNLLP